MAAHSIPAHELQLTSETMPEQILVRGVGRVTAGSAAHLESTVRCFILQAPRVVLDFTGVDYIDSAGLGALVSVYMAANRAGCLLEISNPKPRLRDLFKITKLASVFEGHGENYFGGM